MDNRQTFIQKQTRIHNNYLHSIYGEGLYVGSSLYKGREEPDCASGSEYIYAPLLEGVEIYKNIIDSTGMDGIQIGSSIKDCLV